MEPIRLASSSASVLNALDSSSLNSFNSNDYDEFTNDSVNLLVNPTHLPSSPTVSNPSTSSRLSIIKLNILGFISSIKYLFSFAKSYYLSQPIHKKITLIVLSITSIISTSLIIYYHKALLGNLLHLSNILENYNNTPIIIWFIMFFISFPPMIGYTALSTLTAALAAPPKIALSTP